MVGRWIWLVVDDLRWIDDAALLGWIDRPGSSGSAGLFRFAAISRFILFIHGDAESWTCCWPAVA